MRILKKKTEFTLGGAVITLYQRVLKERQRIVNELEALNHQIGLYPDGKLICTRNGKYVKSYRRTGKEFTYIPKKERKLAEELAAKNYLTAKASDLRQELEAIDQYIKCHSSDSGSAEELLSDSSPYADLLKTLYTPLSQELHSWMKSPYQHNEKYPEQLIHKSSNGIMVRSKSEAIIAMILHMNQIPFRYECMLQLGSKTIYPDFTIRHPESGEIFYWEHFGLMDHAEYCENAYSKMQLYTSYGIYPSVQLITTFETKDKPLDSELVEIYIDHYFK